ncbi:hypothetical protein FRC12_011292 [Ceratobasidium sp. 428]|nr:hypothetical protein FRC12_011292 [Ceratobasidium sp. 428]
MIATLRHLASRPCYYPKAHLPCLPVLRKRFNPNDAHRRKHAHILSQQPPPKRHRPAQPQPISPFIPIEAED